LGQRKSKAFPSTFVFICRIFEAVHERNGRNQKEITVEKGDILEVKSNNN
jgi:hypothetical protein